MRIFSSYKTAGLRAFHLPQCTVLAHEACANEEEHELFTEVIWGTMGKLLRSFSPVVWGIVRDKFRVKHRLEKYINFYKEVLEATAILVGA